MRSLRIWKEKATLTEYEAIALLFAAFGLGLGLFNAWWSLSRDTARLHIVPKFNPISPNVQPQTPWLAVHIANSGFFTVTVDDVSLYSFFGLKKVRVNPLIPQDVKWPIVLKQGTAAYINVLRKSPLHPDESVSRSIDYCYGVVVRLATGEHFHTRSFQVVRFVRAAP